MRKFKSNIILALIVVLMLSLVGCSKDDNKDKDDKKQTVSEKDDADDKKDNDKKEDKTTAATTEELAEPAFEEYYLVDYAVFMKYLVEDTTYGDHSRNLDLVAGCQVFDSDGDGYKELYAQVLSNGFNGNCYVISPSNKPGIFISSQSGPAGECCIQYSSVENQIYYRTSYSTVGTMFANYYKYNGNNDMYLEMSYIQTLEVNEYPGVYKEEANWRGDVQTRTRNETEESLYDEWYEKINSLNLDMIDNNYNSITNIVSSDGIQKAIIGMEKHLNSLGVKYFTTAVDLDGNGTKEQVYAIENYCTKWVNNTNAENCFDNQMFYDVSPVGVVYIVLDGNDDETNIYVDIKYEAFEISKIEDKDGLSVTGAYEYNITYNVYTPGEDMVLNFDFTTTNNDVNSQNGQKLEVLSKLLAYKYFKADPMAPAFYEYIFNDDGTCTVNEYIDYIEGAELNSSRTENYYIDELTKKVVLDDGAGWVREFTYRGEYECLMTDITYVAPDPNNPETIAGYRGDILIEVERDGWPTTSWLYERRNEIIKLCE